FWTVSSHGAQGYDCDDCHTYHGSTGGPLFLDAASQTCMASGCHNNLSTVFNQVSGGPISHHRIEGGTGISLACVNCHNPHLSQAHPNAAINPDNKWQIYALPDTARTSKTQSYNNFCLSCHDGTPPSGVTGALNIATERNGGTIVTLFKKGGDALHKEAHKGYSCFNCHDEHGSSGTTGINRGRLLLNYMRVNNFNNGYSGKGSCSTPTTPGGFRCH
ncbi:MAG: cytochrome c3 family protein, partial [Deltaproteobacteria bacterium]|nr:cytochrome c3 family protein [Deltaproteobacteria bacterium]